MLTENPRSHRVLVIEENAKARGEGELLEWTFREVDAIGGCARAKDSFSLDRVNMLCEARA